MNNIAHIIELAEGIRCDLANLSVQLESEGQLLLSSIFKDGAHSTQAGIDGLVELARGRAGNAGQSGE